MATRLYLTDAAAPYTPATVRGAWDDTAGAVTKALFGTRADGGVTTTVARAETNAAANFDVLLYRGVGPPLAAQTLSGTIQVCLGALESSASADFAYHVHVYVTQGDSDTPRGTILTDYVETITDEWPTAIAGKSLTAAQTLGSLAVSTGDRVVVEIGYVALNVSVSSFTGTLRYGTQTSGPIDMTADLTAGSTSVTTLAPWVEFSGTFSEDAAGTAAKVSQAGLLALDAGSATAAKVSQAGLLALTGAPITVRVSQAGLLVLCGIGPEVAPELGQSFGPLIWAEWLGSDATRRVWAQVDLNDPSTYYGGYKAPKLTLAGLMTRTLSDEDGQLQSPRFEVEVSDIDRTLRTLLGRADAQRLIVNTPIVVRMISDDDRRAQLTPRTVAIGVVRDYRLH